MKRVSLAGAMDCYFKKEEFNCNGTFFGRKELTGFGRMPYGEEYRELSEGKNFSKNPIVFIVYSYDTPVAWVYKNGRRKVTNYKYSQTTSCQISRAGLHYSMKQYKTVVAMRKKYAA